MHPLLRTVGTKCTCPRRTVGNKCTSPLRTGNNNKIRRRRAQLDDTALGMRLRLSQYMPNKERGIYRIDAVKPGVTQARGRGFA